MVEIRRRWTRWWKRFADRGVECNFEYVAYTPWLSLDNKCASILSGVVPAGILKAYTFLLMEAIYHLELFLVLLFIIMGYDYEALMSIKVIRH